MNNQAKGQVVVMWIIWFALLTGVFVLRLVIVIPSCAGTGGLWRLALVPVVIATGIRWFMIPRVTDFANALTLFIIGMALSESACITGMFAFSEHLSVLFNFGVVSMLQFMPLFAHDIAERDGNG